MLLKIAPLMLFSLAVMISTPSFGQEGSLFLAGVSLRLGMPQAQVMGTIGDKYGITKAEGYDLWAVFEKANQELIGTLTFKEGKLIGASRDWGNFQGDQAIRLGKALFSVLSNANEDGKTVAIVTTQTIRIPKLSGQVIRIAFGEKNFSIDISEGDALGKPRVSIQENLGR
jgi:hypothetical protein